MDIHETLDLAEKINKIGKVADFESLTPKNIKVITDAIGTVNEFNKKISKYGKHIFESVYLGRIKDWNERLSEKDFDKAFGKKILSEMKKDKYSDLHHHNFVLCYDKMRPTKYEYNSGWTCGARGPVNTSYTFKKNMLVVTNRWKTQSSRFNHIPWIERERTFLIDLTKMSVDVTGENINAIR